MDSECLVCSSSSRIPCESYPDALRWFEQIHHSQGDCLIPGYMSSLLEEPYTDLTQNSLSDLATLWGQFSLSERKRFRETYDYITSLMSMPIEEPLLRAAMRF